VRPSELYGIRDELAAWCFDRAIHLFGISLEHDLQEAEAKAKKPWMAQLNRQRVLQQWLGVEVKFRDPGGKAKTQDQAVEVTSETSGPVRL
jgi:hypothetical protein